MKRWYLPLAGLIIVIISWFYATYWYEPAIPEYANGIYDIHGNPIDAEIIRQNWDPYFVAPKVYTDDEIRLLKKNDLWAGTGLVVVGVLTLVEVYGILRRRYPHLVPPFTNKD